jgi:soluble lytic murein transglycosylase
LTDKHGFDFRHKDSWLGDADGAELYAGSIEKQDDFASVLSFNIHLMIHDISRPLRRLSEALLLVFNLGAGVALGQPQAIQAQPQAAVVAAAVKNLAEARTLAEKKQFDLAKERLTHALAVDGAHQLYAHYWMGHVLHQMGQSALAVSHFESVLEERKSRSARAARDLAFDARFELSDVLLALGKTSAATTHLNTLERRGRGRAQYPEVVWRLLGAELKLNRRWQACRWARKLYASYPGFSKIETWGVDLPENEYDGAKLGCLAGPKDLTTRIKRLQLLGLAEKARAELDILMSRRSEGSKFDVDRLKAEFLEFQGFPDEALQILLSHYPERKNEFSFLTLFGKISARAGEFPSAVGAYYGAYQKTPGGQAGRKALFQAAFLSYQFQDYDGASRKFQEFIRRFPGSGLSRDAKWHLAWIRYLRKDYASAEKSFRALASETVRHRRRRVQPFNNERTRYWLAMSLWHQKKNPEAAKIFKAIAQDQSLGFYSYLAKERLKPLAGVTAAVSSSNGAPPLTSPSTDGAEPPKDTVEDTPESTESSESEEDLKMEASDDAGSEGGGSEGGGGAPEDVNEAFGDEVQVTSFKDPALQARFDLASLFIANRQVDWARNELFEIESRTSNRQYLRRLMEAYTQVGAFHRAAYISEIFFGGERRSGGLTKAKDLWQWNFPQAFREDVTASANRAGVSPELVWSIMRAESTYFPEATSPVGARGLMQIMPYTAEQIAKLLGDGSYNRNNLSEPALNIRYGASYLARLQKKFKDQIPLVAAAYNAGPHRVFAWLNNFGNLDTDEFIEHIPFVETRNYVKKVLRHYIVYRTLYKNDWKSEVLALTSPIPVRIKERPSPRENWGALE